MNTLTTTALFTFCSSLCFCFAHHFHHQPSACMSHLNGNAAANSATAGYQGFLGGGHHLGHHHQHNVHQHQHSAGSPLPPPTYDTATTPTGGGPGGSSKLAADFRRTQSARFNGQVVLLLTLKCFACLLTNLCFSSSFAWSHHCTTITLHLFIALPITC